MAQLGRYCKAYPVERLREFSGWPDGALIRGSNANNEAAGAAGGDPADAEDDFLYLQENYVVTAGIFMDEQVLFDDVTPEWVEFCKNELHFEAPNYS